MYETSRQRKSIDSFVECMRPKQPRFLVLFGSLATGDFTDSSDADVFVVFDNAHDWLDVYACSDGVVQPLVMSVDQMMRRLEDGDSLIHEMVGDGVLLFGAAESWQTVRARSHQVQTCLQMIRHRNAWSYGSRR